MKRIYNYLFLAILALTACNDDFLDRTPLDKVTDDKFWETEDHVRAAANAGYAGLIGKDMINMGECLADNVMWYQLNAWRQIGSGLYGSDLSTLNSRWSDSYTYIRRANYFLENYNRAVSVPVEIRERYAAEVKFHRAFQYWLLTSFFGDVPYITKALTVNDTEELYKGRTPRSQVIDSIMNDLETSYKYLPEYIEPASKEFGRITQAAHLTLLARIAMQNNRYAEAESAAKRVIELKKYGIYTTGKPNQDYYDLFTFGGRASRKSANTETILAFVYNYDLGQTGTKHNLSRELQVPDQEVRFQPTRDMIDAYLCTDGLAFNKSPLADSSTYASIFENRDPRMKQSIMYPGAVWYGGYDGDHDAALNVFHYPKFTNDKKGAVSLTGFYSRKYCEPTKVPVYNQDDNDIVLIRYAEVLLIYAEAMFEQGKLTQDIVDVTINQLRDRVGMKRMVLTDIDLNGQDLRTELHRERRVELYFEGLRWFDIVRWKEGWRLGAVVKGIKRSWAFNPSLLSNRKVDNNNNIIFDDTRTFEDPKNYLFSLPYIQMERNPNLKPNNPGWE
jgi:hypothetical protein